MKLPTPFQVVLCSILAIVIAFFWWVGEFSRFQNNLLVNQWTTKDLSSYLQSAVEIAKGQRFDSPIYQCYDDDFWRKLSDKNKAQGLSCLTPKEYPEGGDFLLKDVLSKCDPLQSLGNVHEPNDAQTYSVVTSIRNYYVVYDGVWSDFMTNYLHNTLPLSIEETRRRGYETKNPIMAYPTTVNAKQCSGYKVFEIVRERPNLPDK